MRVIRPRADEDDADEWYPVVGIGQASQSMYGPKLTDEDESQYRKELRRQEQRRRPIGFQAKWTETRPRVNRRPSHKAR